jgi:glycosyltransferase involved in cell wall biosynthesis
MNRYPGRLAVQQRVLPSYRAPFFDLLASACDGGMSLFTGLPRRSEGITTANLLQNANYKPGQNIHLFDGALYLCYQRGLIEWLETWNPDALIVEANPRYLSTPAAVKWMHERKKPVLGWGLGSPRFDFVAKSAAPLPKGYDAVSHRRARGTDGVRATRNLFGKKAWSAFINQFDGLIAYSQRGADEYAALGFPREKIFVAYNSVSPPPSSPIPLRPSTFDPSAGSGQALRPTVLFVGRLQARKRIEDLLLACSQIEPHPRLVIVGDGPERERLEALARDIYPAADFVGAKHGAELKPYFTKADLFVLPGTGGLAVQEAMSYGLPVIVAQGDGTQDDLVRRENGWQIPPDSVHYLIHIMKEALSDVSRLRRMGEESYRIVKEEINIEKMVEVFVTALNKVTKKR